MEFRFNLPRVWNYEFLKCSFSLTHWFSKLYNLLQNHLEDLLLKTQITNYVDLGSAPQMYIS